MSRSSRCLTSSGRKPNNTNLSWRSTSFNNSIPSILLTQASTSNWLMPAAKRGNDCTKLRSARPSLMRIPANAPFAVSGMRRCSTQLTSPGRQGGLPTVANGLSLCKMHHGAYDSGLIGITPDLTIEVNHDVLNEIDGPMLRHGIQEFHGRSLMVLPKHKAQRPDRDALDLRYQQFLSSSSTRCSPYRRSELAASGWLNSRARSAKPRPIFRARVCILGAKSWRV